jgi:NDP-sugar pyrophosphorylase family protein
MSLTAVILAGGIGKRFAPYITDKTLFPFMGQPLLERTLRSIAAAGIPRAIVATNAYNHEWVEENAKSIKGLKITAHRQEEPNGMAGALLSLQDVLPEKDIIVMNAGDMVEESLLHGLVKAVKGQTAMVTGMDRADYQPVGYLIMDGDRVVGIAEKPGADNMPSTLINLVFHYFSSPGEFLDLLNAKQAVSENDDIYERALSTMMERGDVGVYRYSGRWQKLKFGFHVLDMVEYFLADLQPSIDPTAMVAPSAKIIGNVVISAGAKVFDGAIISGPCYIGPNAIVGNGALVRSSIVEAGATVGFGSEVARSYVGASCDLHHAYVGDSVLEHHVHFGFNAHTANYRLDQQPITLKWSTAEYPSEKIKLGACIAAHTEIGVNVSIMPGTAIGHHAVLYPATVAYEPVGDNMLLKEERTQTQVPRPEEN